MSAPTLTEFLLARIAEDEAEARRDLTKERHEGPWSEAWQTPDRELAECEAKRAIIHELDYMVRDGDYQSERVFKHMAAPHADHPDYDQAWAADATNPEDFR